MTDTYILCDEDDMCLEHIDNSNQFMLSFSVLEKYNNVVEIVESDELFILLKTLNDDNIRNVEQTILQNNIYETILTINTPKTLHTSNAIDPVCNIIMKYSKHITNTITILSDVSQNNKSILQVKDNIKQIYISNFCLKVKNINNQTTFEIEFLFDSNVNENINKFLALYIKKLFKKIKLYFDMV